MKINTATVIIVLLLMISLTGLGVRAYYKSAERALIETYDAQIEKNEKIIAEYRKENDRFYEQIVKDSLSLIKKDKEIAKLKQQNTTIQHELLDAKNTLKDKTAGEAIKFVEEYAQITDSKMLVQNADTSVVFNIPAVKKIGGIFLEHKYQKLEITNLNQIVFKQNSTIFTANNSITALKGIILNKDAEIALQRDNGGLEVAKIRLTADKYKAQRNRARAIIVGTLTVAVGIIAVTK